MAGLQEHRDPEVVEVDRLAAQGAIEGAVADRLLQQLDVDGIGVEVERDPLEGLPDPLDLADVERGLLGEDLFLPGRSSPCPLEVLEPDVGRGLAEIEPGREIVADRDAMTLLGMPDEVLGRSTSIDVPVALAAMADVGFPGPFEVVPFAGTLVGQRETAFPDVIRKPWHGHREALGMRARGGTGFLQVIRPDPSDSTWCRRGSAILAEDLLDES